MSFGLQGMSVSISYQISLVMRKPVRDFQHKPFCTATDDYRLDTTDLDKRGIVPLFFVYASQSRFSHDVAQKTVDLKRTCLKVEGTNMFWLGIMFMNYISD